MEEGDKREKGEVEITEKKRPSPWRMVSIAIIFFLIGISLGALMWYGKGETTPAAGLIETSHTEPTETSLKNEVEKGDTVEVRYVGKLLSGEEVEKKDKVKFKVGSGEEIESLEEAVIGMKKGEEKTIRVPPEKAYGAVDPNKIMEIQRVQVMPRFREMPLEQFKQTIGEEPRVNKSYQVTGFPWAIKIFQISNATVTLDSAPEKETEVEGIIGKFKVTFNETKIKMALQAEPEINSFIKTPQGEKAKVLASDEERIKLDFNHPLAGKTLKFRIKLIDFEKGKPLSVSGLEKWEKIKGLGFEELQEKYLKLLDYTEPYIIREGIKSIAVPSGVPEIYGKELKLEFDADRADEMISIMREYEDDKLTEEQMERYKDIALRTSCEYCCGVRALIREDGTRACGCAHSYAMRGLAKYLILYHGDEYTDDEILKELNEWKAFFFPKQSIQKVLKARAETGEVDLSVLQEMPSMVGGC